MYDTRRAALSCLLCPHFHSNWEKFEYTVNTVRLYIAPTADTEMSSEVSVFSKACTVVEYQNSVYFFETDGKVLIWQPELYFTEYENVEQVVQEAPFPVTAFINTLLFF